MPGRAEGIPGDVEPAVAGEELVGVFAGLQKLHERPEPCRVAWTDVGGLADEVLRVADTAHLPVHGLTAEAGVDVYRLVEVVSEGLQHLGAQTYEVVHFGCIYSVLDMLPICRFTMKHLFERKMVCEFHNGKS